MDPAPTPDSAGPAVFLDRDGTVNQLHFGPRGRIHPPPSPAEVVLLPGVQEACTQLKAAGLRLFLVTNQPDVARGTQARPVVEAINRHVSDLLAIDDVAVCFHDDIDACACRKPKAGLVLELADRHGVALNRSVVVGDRESDVEAGRAAGCRTVRIAADEPGSAADLVVPTLLAAVPYVLEVTRALRGIHA